MLERSFRATRGSATLSSRPPVASQTRRLRCANVSSVGLPRRGCCGSRARRMRASLAASQVPSGSGGPDGVRRLVVLSYHFPPDGAVGGLRWSGLTKYLARLGWSCWVVTAASPAGTEVANGVTVESCPRRRTLNDVYRWLRLRPGLQRVGRGPNEPFGEPLEQAALGWVARMRLEAAMLLSVPDHGRGLILRAAAVGRSV